MHGAAAPAKLTPFDPRNPDADNPLVGVRWETRPTRALWVGPPRKADTATLLWYYLDEWAPPEGVFASIEDRTRRPDVWYRCRQEPVRVLDFTQTDRGYWRTLFTDILALRAVNSRRVIDRIRHERYVHQQPRRVRWEARFRPEILAWAWEALREYAREVGEACIDNYRVARVTNRAQMREYRRTKQEGCCGFADRRVWGPDRQEYWIGFNYGH